MTFKLRPLLLLLLFVSQIMMGQDIIKNNIKLEAERMSKATLNGDYKILIEYTHPNVIKFSGGKQKILDLLEKQMGGMADNGFTIDDVTIDEPVIVKLHKGKYQALVPKTTFITSNNQKIISKDYLFGFSDSEGKIWTFVEAEKLKSEAAKQIFPGFTTDITIPEKEVPKTVEDEGLINVPKFDENAGTYNRTDKIVDNVFGVIGLVVGIVFFIIVIVVVIFLIIYFNKKKKEGEVTTTKVQTPVNKKIETKICKECEGKNRPDSKYCAFCGYTLGS